MYYVYLLRNKKTKEIYIGYTKDLKRRILEHHAKNPELLYYEAYSAEQDARVRELKLKQRGQSVRRLKVRLEHSFL